MTQTEITRYQVQSTFECREYYWVWDTHKHCRIGNITFQAGRASKRASELNTDWLNAIDRLGVERATFIYG